MNEPETKLLCDRFPEHCDLIHRLAQINSSFKEIVQDYADVIKVLNKWRISKEPFANSRIKEYQMLSKELESEIEQLLLDTVKSVSP